MEVGHLSNMLKWYLGIRRSTRGSDVEPVHAPILDKNPDIPIYSQNRVKKRGR